LASSSTRRSTVPQSTVAPRAVPTRRSHSITALSDMQRGAWIWRATSRIVACT